MEKPDNRCSTHSNEDIVLVKNEPNAKHYGKWVCADPECSKFVRWAKQPKTTDALVERQNNIIIILGQLYERDKSDKTDKTQKTIRFILSIYSTVHLNLVQQSTYDKIVHALNP